MNSIIREYLPTSFFEGYQALRDQLLEIVTDDDLRARLGGDTLSLGELCRWIGEIEHSYVDSFRTFRQDWEYRNRDALIETSVGALQAWYAEMDSELMAALEALSEDDIANRHIIRSDWDPAEFSPSVSVQLDLYRESLLIFYGKASVYLRALGRTFPDQWRVWIELPLTTS